MWCFYWRHLFISQTVKLTVLWKSTIWDCFIMKSRLHWLPVQQRITYKLAVMTYNCTPSPDYLLRDLRTEPAADLYANPPTRCWQNCSLGQAFQTCFPAVSAVCLELTDTLIILMSDSLLSNPRSKPTCSADRLLKIYPACRQLLWKRTEDRAQKITHGISSKASTTVWAAFSGKSTCRQHVIRLQGDLHETSTKAIMDHNSFGTCFMEGPGRRPLAYLLYCNAYGKPRLPPVHKYSSLRSTTHRAAAYSRPLRAVDAALHALCRQCSSEGSVSSFKSITWKEVW